jgi:hypothetical protein
MRCRRPDAAQSRHYWMAGCRSCVLADAIERSILAFGRSATRQSPDVALHRPPKFALLMGAGKPGVPAPSSKPASLAIPDPESPLPPSFPPPPGPRASVTPCLTGPRVFGVSCCPPASEGRTTDLHLPAHFPFPKSLPPFPPSSCTVNPFLYPERSFACSITSHQVLNYSASGITPSSFYTQSTPQKPKHPSHA